jgi:hypothetical protein
MASSQLKMMVEGGDISELSAMLTTADKAENPAMGVLAPPCQPQQCYQPLMVICLYPLSVDDNNHSSKNLSTI